MTLAPTSPAMLIDDAIAPSIPRTPRAARAGRAVRAVRRSWWRWLDFDSELLAQVWVICCTQILILAVAGLVIHASAASPY